jgi:hypothetical protein
MEYRTLWNGVSVAVILRFYPKRVETKKNAGFFLVQAPELPRCREMGNALSPGLGDAELQKFTW